jgi:hypothetical protein
MSIKPATKALATALVAAGFLLPASAAPRPDEKAEKTSEEHERRVARDVVVLTGEHGPGHLSVFNLVGRGYLGVELTPLTGELRAHFGAPEDAGVLVARVVPDSPAAEAGLRVGDVIASVDGESVEGAIEIARLVRRHEAGESVTLEIYRDGRPQSLTATVRERDREAFDVGEMFEWRAGEGEHQPMLKMRRHDCPPGCAGLLRPEAFERIGESLKAIDWSELPERIDLSNAKLEERIEELEERLAQMRQELEKLTQERR